MKHKIIDKLREIISTISQYEKYCSDMVSLGSSGVRDELNRYKDSLDSIITDLTLSQGEPDLYAIDLGLDIFLASTSKKIVETEKKKQGAKGDILEYFTAPQSPQGVDFDKFLDDIYDIISSWSDGSVYIDSDKFKQVCEKHISPAPNTELLRDIRAIIKENTSAIRFLNSYEKSYTESGVTSKLDLSTMISTFESLLNRIDNELGGGR